MSEFETTAKCVALYAALRKAVRTRQMTNRPGSDWSLSSVAELPEYHYGRNKVLISATENGEKFEVLVFNNQGRQIHNKAYKGLDAAFRNGEKFSEVVYPEPAAKTVAPEEAPAATEPTTPGTKPSTSERYPVGTQVQVKNGGHGSQFRTETERVGEFAGVVVATSGADYTGIPEVCIESSTGERRVILVGDLEEAPEPTPEKKPATEFQVKIWYVESGYEEIDHAPAHVATTIYAECEDNPRVVAAEIHGCATHKLHQSFGRELDSAPVVG